jgi:hypothetical protein
VNLRPGRVQSVRLVEQPQASHRDSDRRIGEPTLECPDRPRRDDRVRADENQAVARSLLRAGVTAASKAEILARRDDSDSIARLSVLDLRPAIAVVDDDDLVGLSRERVEAAPELRP